MDAKYVSACSQLRESKGGMSQGHLRDWAEMQGVPLTCRMTTGHLSTSLRWEKSFLPCNEGRDGIRGCEYELPGLGLAYSS